MGRGCLWFKYFLPLSGFDGTRVTLVWIFSTHKAFRSDAGNIGLDIFYPQGVSVGRGCLWFGYFLPIKRPDGTRVSLVLMFATHTVFRWSDGVSGTNDFLPIKHLDRSQEYRFEYFFLLHRPDGAKTTNWIESPEPTDELWAGFHEQTNSRPIGTVYG